MWPQVWLQRFWVLCRSRDRLWCLSLPCAQSGLITCAVCVDQLLRCLSCQSTAPACAWRLPGQVCASWLLGLFLLAVILVVLLRRPHLG